MFKLTDFQIGLKIGQGSFAEVKKCIHRESGHVIAFKTYDKRKIIESNITQAV
jgi:serine/threonine protein kinase